MTGSFSCFSGKGVESAGEKTDFMLKVVPFLNFLLSVKIWPLCFLRKFTEIISTTDSCNGFLRDRGVLRAIPPFCPESN